VTCHLADGVTYNVSSKSNPQCVGPSCGLKYLTNDPIYSDPLHELNSDIAKFQHVVTIFPRTSPLRIGCIKALASALAQRYSLLRQVDDLEQSILCLTEVIFLPPHWDRRLSNITQDLYSTAQLLFSQEICHMHPEDVKRPVIYLRYLHGQSPEAFNISPNEVKESLMRSLALQVVLGLGDVMQDMEEMADLFLELLNSDTWTILTDIITSFAQVVKHRHESWGNGKEPLARVIYCLRKAKSRLPDSDKLSITLSCILLGHFRIAPLNNDYKEGTIILDKILTSHGPGDDPSQYREALEVITAFAQAQFGVSGKPEHLEEVIYRLWNWVHWIPLEDPNRPYFICKVCHAATCRRRSHMGVLADADSIPARTTSASSIYLYLSFHTHQWCHHRVLISLPIDIATHSPQGHHLLDHHHHARTVLPSHSSFSSLLHHRPAIPSLRHTASKPFVLTPNLG